MDENEEIFYERAAKAHQLIDAINYAVDDIFNYCCSLSSVVTFQEAEDIDVVKSEFSSIITKHILEL